MPITKYNTSETLTRYLDCAGSQHYTLPVRQCLWVGTPHKRARHDWKCSNGTEYDIASSVGPLATDSQIQL
eukprot:2528693-Pleurochrysis_carterae.AAC.1